MSNIILRWSSPAPRPNGDLTGIEHFMQHESDKAYFRFSVLCKMHERGEIAHLSIEREQDGKEQDRG